MRLRARKEPRCHTHGFFTNGRDAGFVQNFQAGLARIQRGNVRRAVQVAEGIFAEIDGASLEPKGTLVRKPPSDRRLELRAQVFPHVQIADAGTAAEPLEHATTCKIGA